MTLALYPLFAKSTLVLRHRQIQSYMNNVSLCTLPSNQRTLPYIKTQPNCIRNNRCPILTYPTEEKTKSGDTY